MAQQDFLDDLLSDDGSPLTDDEVQERWQRLFATDMRGRGVYFANSGGDMMRVQGMAKKIVPIGKEVLLKLEHGTICPDGEDFIGPPESLKKPFMLLGTNEPPEFHENGTIILHDIVGGGYDWSCILDIGFIYPKRT